MSYDQRSASIFEEYYAKKDFADRDEEHGATIIIPVFHTNELWEANHHSIYREIPVTELIHSNGGRIGNTVEIAKKFSYSVSSITGISSHWGSACVT